jgi:hypothetical protein
VEVQVARPLVVAVAQAVWLQPTKHFLQVVLLLPQLEEAGRDKLPTLAAKELMEQTLPQ